MSDSDDDDERVELSDGEIRKWIDGAMYLWCRDTELLIYVEGDKIVGDIETLKQQMSLLYADMLENPR